MVDSNELESLSKAFDYVSINDAQGQIRFVDLLTTNKRLRKRDLKWLFAPERRDPSESVVVLATVEIVINTVVQLHISVSSRFLVVRALVKMFMSEDANFCKLRSYLEDPSTSKVFVDLPSPLYSKDKRPVLCAMDMARLCNVFLPIDTPVLTLDNFDNCPKWFSDSKRPPSSDDLAPLVKQLRLLAVSVSLERFESPMGNTLREIFHPEERDRAFHWRAQCLLLREVEISRIIQVTYKFLRVKRPIITVSMSQYASRIRAKSEVFVYFRLRQHENERSERATVIRVEGKQAVLNMAAMPTGLQPSNIVKIVLNRKDEGTNRLDQTLAHLLERFNRGDRAEFVSAGSSEISRMLFESSRICESESISIPTIQEALRSRSSLINAWEILNSSQKKSIQQCLSGGPCVKSVSGPPGTGKTRAIAMLTALLHTQAFGDSKIICCAQTNTAARHIASQVAKLCSSKTVALLVSEEFYNEWHEHEYIDLVNAGYKNLPKNMNVMKKRVIICTISHCLTPPMAEFASSTTTVVFDEASQVWDSHARALLTKTKLLKRLCLFGDLAQLPPHFPKRSGNDGEIEIDLQPCTSTLSHVDGSMLDTSYRLPRDLCFLVSCMFYGGRLKAAKPWNNQSSITWHVVQDRKVKVRNGSTFSDLETSTALKIVQNELRTTKDIAVVCFYEAQRRMIAKKLPNLMVKNVDGFQGQEADAIILCLSHQRGSAFLNNPNRMNVACTRAKQRLHIVGNPNICSKFERWRRVFDFSKRESKDWDKFEASMAHAHRLR